MALTHHTLQMSANPTTDEKTGTNPHSCALSAPHVSLYKRKDICATGNTPYRRVIQDNGGENGINRQKLTPAEALVQIGRDVDLRVVNEQLKAAYPEFLLNSNNPEVMLHRLKMQTIDNSPFRRCRDYLCGNKFERAVSRVLRAQAGTPEYRTFKYIKSDDTVHCVNRIDIVWLRCSPEFHFDDREIADYLGCSERQVKAMVKQVRDSGLTFRKYDPKAKKNWGPGIWKTRGNPEIGKKPDVRLGRFDGWMPDAKAEMYKLYRTQQEKAKDYLHLIDHQGYSDWCHEKHTAAYDPDLISDVHTSYDRVGNNSGGNSSHSASASTNQVALTLDDEEASAYENASWKSDGTDKRVSLDRDDEQIFEYDFTDLDKPTIVKKGRESRK